MSQFIDESHHRIDHLRECIREANHEWSQRRKRRQALRSGREVLVTPEDHNPRNTRLEMVDVVGNLSDISDLRQQLADKARQLGGDGVCQMTVTPVGDGNQVLLSGLAVKSPELVKCDRQEKLDKAHYEGLIEDLEDKIDTIECNIYRARQLAQNG